MVLKPNKQLVIEAAINLVPQYVELLRDLQGRGGYIGFSSELAAIQNVQGAYVKLYEDERKIGILLCVALFGETETIELSKELENASPDEQQAFLDEMASFDEEVLDQALEGFAIPKTAAEKQIAREQFEMLSEVEKQDTLKQAACFWQFLFSTFFNTLSLMIHGTKLTALVPLAISGDDSAFLKAVQIDRMLLVHHPYFRERKLKAQHSGELFFLRQLAAREIKPPLQSKIRYPGLYMLFGILESFQWLHDLKHEEILDLADRAGLDRYQNRIEDVGYLTKRFLEFRRWQKSEGLSMH